MPVRIGVSRRIFRFRLLVAGLIKIESWFGCGLRFFRLWFQGFFGGCAGIQHRRDLRKPLVHDGEV